jgi:hypothetical protein
MSVKEHALGKALQILGALKCEYKIITTDGQEHGNLVVVTNNNKRNKPLRPIGTYSNYIRPFIEHLKVGDVAVVPFGEFSGGDLQSNVGARAIHLWGTGSYKSCITGTTVEILRIK